MIIGEAGLKQLSMVLDDLNNMPEVELPPEYILRCYKDGDGEHWINLISNVFGYTSEAAGNSWQEIVQSSYFQPEDVSFVYYDREAVATATARVREDDPSGMGYLHMVAAEPSHKGNNLGKAVVVAACRRLKEKGMTRVLLHTDDFRLPAIAIYLKLGFEPVMEDDEMKDRWAKIRETLRMPRTS
jgi:GNAT superfamily N-acetyltransferase